MLRSYVYKICLSLFVIIFLPLATGLDGTAQPPAPLAKRKIQKSSVDTSVPLTTLFFSPVIYNTGGYDPAWVTVGDVNGDGKPDLLVANARGDAKTAFSASTIGVLLGNGDGTFQSPLIVNSGGSYLHSVLLADVNHDGRLDILAANGCTLIGQGVCSDEGGIGVLLGNGDGTFSTAVDYNTGGFGYTGLTLSAVDVNGDGNLDLIVLNNCSSPCDANDPPQGSVSVMLGNGKGAFQSPSVYASGGYVSSGLAVADLNADQELDVVVANVCGNANVVNCTTPGFLNVLLGSGNGTLQTSVPYASGGQGASTVTVADLNSDGIPDLIEGIAGQTGAEAYRRTVAWESS